MTRRPCSTWGLIASRCQVSHTPLGIEASIPVATVRERYDDVCGVLDRVRSTLAGDINEYLPFYRLHDGLMVEIWDYLAVEDRVTLTAVSRRFRNVALNSATLWRFIHVHSGVTLKQLETLLSRGAQTQLCIYVYVKEPPYPRGSSRSYITPFFYNYLPPPYPPILIHNGTTDAVLAALPRATVLDTVAHKVNGTSVIIPPHVISVESLTMPMPNLRSLRLFEPVRTLSPPPLILGQQPAPQSALFGGETPSLHHLAILDSSLEWSDPIYKNLTYLLIRRPSTRCAFPRLLDILRACPDLTYLGLDSVLGAGDSFQKEVTLPRLERLFVIEIDTYRISSFLENLSTPNMVECDFISADWSLLNKRTLPGSSPLGRFTLTEAVTIISSSHYPYKWMIECRWEERGAIRCHFDSSAHDQPMNITIDDQQSRLIDSLKDSVVPFEQVKTLTIGGTSTSGNATQILELFPSVVTLRAGHLTLNPSPGQTNFQGIIDILSTEYCPQLQDIEIGYLPQVVPSTLVTWLIARSAVASECNRIKRVIVSAVDALPKKPRTKIAAMVDKFKWKRANSLTPVYTPGVTYAPLPTILGTPVPAGVPSSVPTQETETSTWDEDEDPEVGPAPIDHYPPYANVGPDDVTLHFCHSSLHGKWSYWALPGSEV